MTVGTNQIDSLVKRASHRPRRGTATPYQKWKDVPIDQQKSVRQQWKTEILVLLQTAFGFTVYELARGIHVDKDIVVALLEDIEKEGTLLFIDDNDKLFIMDY